MAPEEAEDQVPEPFEHGEEEPAEEHSPPGYDHQVRIYSASARSFLNLSINAEAARMNEERRGPRRPLWMAPYGPAGLMPSSWRGTGFSSRDQFLYNLGQAIMASPTQFHGLVATGHGLAQATREILSTVSYMDYSSLYVHGIPFFPTTEDRDYTIVTAERALLPREAQETTTTEAASQLQHRDILTEGYLPAAAAVSYHIINE